MPVWVSRAVQFAAGRTSTHLFSETIKLTVIRMNAGADKAMVLCNSLIMKR